MSSSRLTAVYFSLANSHHNEGTPYSLDNRISTIIEYFTLLLPSVSLFLLTEGRSCTIDNHATDAIDIGYKMAKSLGMWFSVLSNHGMNSSSPAKIVIYDQTKLFLLLNRNYYSGLSRMLPSGKNYCQCVSGFKFHRILADTYDNQGQCMIDPKLVFNLGFIHAPTDTEGRDDLFKMMVQEFASSSQPWIFPGDYNLFANDSTQQKELLNNHFINMTTDIGTTFIGYPHDVDSNGVPYVGSLDRVYINYNFADQFGSEVTVVANDIIHRGVRLSDHYLLTIDITFE